MKSRHVWISVLVACAGAARGGLAHERADLSGPAGDCFGFLPIDISGAESWGFQGDPDNQVLEVFIGANATIYCIEWDLFLTSVGTSWADEATITLQGSVSINPAAGDSFTVTNANYQGSVQEMIQLDSSGILRIEFHEIGFDDNPGAIDAFYGPGSFLQVGIPSPGTLGVMGLAGLAVCGRRRGRPRGTVG